MKKGAGRAQMENDQSDARYPINIALARSRSHQGSPKNDV